MLIENKFYGSAVRSLAGLIRALDESEIPEFGRLFTNVVEESIDLIVAKFLMELSEATGLETRLLLIERVREEVENLAESLPSRSLYGQTMEELQNRAVLETYEGARQNIQKTARVLDVTDKTIRNYLKRLGVQRNKRRWYEGKCLNEKR
jgi:DNA-binding NtrC family response regulator